MRKICCQSAAFCAAALLVSAVPAIAQSSPERGRVDFTAYVTPASGRTEPARGLTVFLLRKSYRDIRREVDDSTPVPDLNEFVDRLKCSPELKAWMKKNRTVTIMGEEFRKLVGPDDLFRIPEFLDAYVSGNMSALNQGFPAPKYNSEDRTLNPKKYEADRKLYEPLLRKYLLLHPDSKDGMDTILGQVDPSTSWNIEVDHARARAHEHALEIAQTDYLAAKTETNLEGRGAFDAAPGVYWLSTLDGEALGGDMHLHWDVRVQVRAGAATHAELTNLNAEKKP
ncbi:MAG TPA: hypothetical protein VMI93_15870 [Candidatus Solibacter sp.]|nr:hypothetical protein [Candidatus Solibacter sp.]